MKRLSRKQRIWAVLGAGLLVAAVSGSALARQIEDRDVLHLEIQQEKKSTTSASPLPTPEPENEVEFTGSVEVMASNMWVVGGRTIMVTATTEIKSGLEIGVLAQVHAVRQADGALWAREIEAARNEDHGNSNSNDNSNDDHGNNNSNVNSNDDNGNNDNGNVNSNDDNGDDNHGNGNVNSNDDHGNSNDHHGGNGNANDDHGNDDRGGHSNDG